MTPPPPLDERWMRRAITLARRGLYTTTPNPRVGCVLISPEGEVVGEGWHDRAGEPHAEIHALRAAGARAGGATAFVTLEPCAHFGRTPPCADALIQAGVARVVIGGYDPNPLVAGKGAEKLRAAGIRVDGPVLERECAALNPGFLKRMRTGLPWLRLKTAATLDGRLALANGASRWITGQAARRDVHRWRALSCAVLTGIGTVLADDPQLTVRHVRTPRQPVRVVLDPRLVLPDTAALWRDEAPLWVITREDADAARVRQLEARGARVFAVPAHDEERLDLRAVACTLAQQGCNEAWIEAGPTLTAAWLHSGLIDEWIHYLAPVLFGADARALVPALGLTTVADAPRWRLMSQRRFGEDVRLVLAPARG